MGITREKIYERNSNTGFIRWRYVGESPSKFGWPKYGRILNKIPKTKDKPIIGKARDLI